VYANEPLVKLPITYFQQLRRHLGIKFVRRKNKVQETQQLLLKAFVDCNEMIRPVRAILHNALLYAYNHILL
jgi:hypothetical protein